jgi:hypothetical protein
MICKTCNIEREEKYFSYTKSKYNGITKYYFWSKKCKICQGVKNVYGRYNKLTKSDRLQNKIEDGISLSKEAEVFLNSLKIRNGYVDMVDSFKLAHYFIETFGYIDLDDMEVEDQLILMYEKLLKI